MKRFLAIGLLAAVAAGCGGGVAWNDSSSYADPISVDLPAHSDVEVEYMAMCVEENKALGDWQDSHGDAAYHGGVHEDETFGHRYSVIIRQKPAFPMRPDYPKQ